MFKKKTNKLIYRISNDNKINYRIKFSRKLSYYLNLECLLNQKKNFKGISKHTSSFFDSSIVLHSFSIIIRRHKRKKNVMYSKYLKSNYKFTIWTLTTCNGPGDYHNFIVPRVSNPSQKLVIITAYCLTVANKNLYT